MASEVKLITTGDVCVFKNKCFIRVRGVVEMECKCCPLHISRAERPDRCEEIIQTEATEVMTAHQTSHLYR